MGSKPEPKPTDVTQLLSEMQSGHPGAADELFTAVYNELRRIASNYMRHERSGHTLQATALVHEAYFGLIDQTRITWQNRAHFFAVAAQLMRRILVEHARRSHALKRGGAGQKLTLDEVSLLLQEKDVPLEDLDDALIRLAQIDPRQSQIVELRFFAGLTVEETGEVIGASASTVEREWRMAKAWLRCQLRDTRIRTTFRDGFHT